MKAIYNIALLLLFATTGYSQQSRQNDLKSVDAAVSASESADGAEPEYLNGMVPMASLPSATASYADSLRLPLLDSNGLVPSHRWWYHPMAAGYWGWDLHEGLNVNLGLSAFTSFGRNSFSGTAERIAAMYAKPITKKLSIAIGGYFNNINSGIGSMRDAGLSAILNYRFNDRWEAYVYAQKSLVSNGDFRSRYNAFSPYYIYSPFDNLGDRIGAGLRYNFNESTYIEVQVDWNSYPDTGFNGYRSRWQMPGQTFLP